MTEPAYANIAAMQADGWEKLPAKSFNEYAGPYYSCFDERGRIVALLTEERHSNGHLNIVHGGVLMSFADVALGCGCGDTQPSPNMATIQLQYNFTASCKIGSFITCRPEVVRTTSSLVFVRGLVRTGDRTLGAAEGIWRVLDGDRLDAIRSG